MQLYSLTRMQLYSLTRMQIYSLTRMQLCSLTHAIILTHTCNYTHSHARVCNSKLTTRHACKQAPFALNPRTSTLCAKVHTHTHRHTHTHTKTHTQRHTQTHTHTNTHTQTHTHTHAATTTGGGQHGRVGFCTPSGGCVGPFGTPSCVSWPASFVCDLRL